MKYKSPQVEDYETTDDVPNAPKRKRDADIGDVSTSADAPPPSKTSKSSEYSADQEDEVLLDDDVIGVSKPSTGSGGKGTRGRGRPSGKDKSKGRGKGKDEHEHEDENQGEEEELLQDEVFDEGAVDEDLSQEGTDYEESDEAQADDAQRDKGGRQKKKQGSPSAEKLQKTIEMYGRGPLEGTAIEKEALSGSPATVLAMLMDAMLKSKPMSHGLTDRTLRKLVEVGYHDIRKLGDASWEERAMVLKDGGYNRYREQGSTNLGKLVELVNEKYDGDLNNLIKEAGQDPQKARELVKEIHGLGDLGVELFFNNVQSVWPSIAPFVDFRSMHTAEDAGLGTDLDALYEVLDKDPVRMCKLANALSAARLEKRIGDLVQI